MAEGSGLEIALDFLVSGQLCAQVDTQDSVHRIHVSPPGLSPAHWEYSRLLYSGTFLCLAGIYVPSSLWWVSKAGRPAPGSSDAQALESSAILRCSMLLKQFPVAQLNPWGPESSFMQVKMLCFPE